MSLSTIPAGSVIERVYWAVPDHYTAGPQFDTYAEALTFAVNKLEAAIAKHEERRATEGPLFVPLPERMFIDLRWYVAVPTGGGVDFTADRVTFQSLAQAKGALKIATNRRTS